MRIPEKYGKWLTLRAWYNCFRLAVALIVIAWLFEVVHSIAFLEATSLELKSLYLIGLALLFSAILWLLALLSPELMETIFSMLGFSDKEKSKVKEESNDNHEASSKTEEKHQSPPKEVNEEDKVDILVALSEYYSSRTTQSASLFVAAVFGLITYSAIVQSVCDSNIWLYFISLFPYVAFTAATWLTWKRFKYWQDIANEIEIILRVKDQTINDFIEQRYDLYNKGRIGRILDFFVRHMKFTLIMVFIFLTIVAYHNFLVLLSNEILKFLQKSLFNY